MVTENVVRIFLLKCVESQQTEPQQLNWSKKSIGDSSTKNATKLSSCCLNITAQLPDWCHVYKWMYTWDLSPAASGPLTRAATTSCWNYHCTLKTKPTSAVGMPNLTWHKKLKLRVKDAWAKKIHMYWRTSKLRLWLQFDDYSKKANCSFDIPHTLTFWVICSWSEKSTGKRFFFFFFFGMSSGNTRPFSSSFCWTLVQLSNPTNQ